MEPSSGALGTYVIPLVWRALAAQERNSQVDFKPFLREAIETAGGHDMINAFVAYLEGQRTPIELSSLVDLPDDGEAHFIDTETNLLAGLLEALALGLRPTQSESQRLGRALRFHRDRLASTAELLRGRKDATTNGIEEQIAMAATALSTAVAEAERDGWLRLRGLPIDLAHLRELTVMAQRTITANFPRSLLGANGVAYDESGGLPWQRVTLRIRMPKEMLAVPSEGDGLLADQIGESFARVEASRFEASIRHARGRTYGAARISDRVVAALADLGSADTDTVILAPFRWQVVDALTRELGVEIGLRDQRGKIASFQGASLIQVPFETEDSLFVLQLPGAVHLTAKGSEAEWLGINTEDVPTSEDSSGPPELLATVDEYLVFTVDRALIRRVRIPEQILP